MNDQEFDKKLGEVLSSLEEFEPSKSYSILTQFHDGGDFSAIQKEKINGLRFYFGAQKIVAEEARFEEALEMMNYSNSLLKKHGSESAQKMSNAYLLYYHAMVFLRRKEHQAAFEKIRELEELLANKEVDNGYLEVLALLAKPEILFIEGTTLMNIQQWDKAKAVIEEAFEQMNSITSDFTDELLLNSYLGIAFYYKAFYDFNVLLDAFLRFDVNSVFIHEDMKINTQKAIEYLSKGDLSILGFKTGLLTVKSIQIITDILIDQKHQLLTVQRSFDSKEVINRRFYSIHLERNIDLAIDLLTEAKLGLDVLVYQRVRDIILNIDKFLVNIYSSVNREISSTYASKRNNTFDEIRQLVAKGHLEKAINLAFQTIDERAAIDKIILLQFRLNTTLNNDRLGLETKERTNVELSKLTLALLDILTEIEQE